MELLITISLSAATAFKCEGKQVYVGSVKFYNHTIQRYFAVIYSTLISMNSKIGGQVTLSPPEERIFL